MSKLSTEDYNEFIATYKRAQNNAVFFLEHFWNVAHPDKAIELTDEDKERLFAAHYHMVPMFNDFKEANIHAERVAEMKAKGLKNWEIY